TRPDGACRCCPRGIGRTRRPWRTRGPAASRKTDRRTPRASTRLRSGGDARRRHDPRSSAPARAARGRAAIAALRPPRTAHASYTRRVSCAVMNYLFKEEPAHYSYDDLVRDGRTSWTGVKNPVAQRHLRGVRKGDRIFSYHTGDEKSVVGICRAAGDAYPDPPAKSPTLSAASVNPAT